MASATGGVLAGCGSGSACSRGSGHWLNGGSITGVTVLSQNAIKDGLKYITSRRGLTVCAPYQFFQNRARPSQLSPQPPNKTNVVGRMLPGDAAESTSNELGGPMEQCHLCEHINGRHPGPMRVPLGHGVESKDPLP
eukprot:395-Pyramimonas_sp.AAC.1